MKSTYLNVFSLFFTITFLMSSCASEPTLCECLTTKGDLPYGCEKVFENTYGTSDPSPDRMESDYYNCK